MMNESFCWMKKLKSIQRTGNPIERTIKVSSSATYSPATHLFLFFSPGQNLAAAAATSARVMRAVFMSWCHGVVQEWALELVVSRHTDPGLKYHPPARPGPAMGTLGK